jgi:hypothetical protein
MENRTSAWTRRLWGGALAVSESDKNAKRALKIIPTRGLTMSEADCQRELAAMMEFRKPKVCNIFRPRSGSQYLQ